MTCAPDHIVRRFCFFIGWVAFAVLALPRAEALERPTASEWLKLTANPDELQLRTQKAMRYGNYKVKPWVAASAAQRLSVLASGGNPEELPPPAWRGMPTKGTNNVLVFLIDFPDAGHVNGYDLITNKLFGAGIPADFPVESLSKFYERSSYGMLKLQGSALGWYRMQHTRDWYTDTYGTGNEANYAIIKEVSDYFDASIDYRQFDNNGDGKIDYFAVLWAGADNGWANFWWGYQWELFQNLTHDGVKFETFSWQWESNPSYPPYRADFTPGVVIHETGHALGLPDYYDYDGSVGPDGGVGGMDMMDSGSYDHNGFSKFMLEWMTPTIVSNSVDNLPLRSAADYPEAVALAKGYSGTNAFAEYFMVQNRQKVNNDQKLPGAGLVIWHIDARLNAGGTDFLYNNSYAAHKLLRLMEADGLEQIETDRDADSSDIYGPGKIFTPESTPNSQSYAGLSTEVRVTDISAPGVTMTADFSARDNSPVLDPSPVYVREGSTTNVSVSLWQAPTTNVVLTVGWFSGSSNLYVAGESNFTFTTSDYMVPQTLFIGSFSDADSNNDVAVFRFVSSGPSAQGTDFAVQQMDTGDSLPPACVITASANGDRSQVIFDFLFDEAISGFEASDIVATDNIVGGAVLVGDVIDITGSNRSYRAVFDCADQKGAIQLTVPAGSLTDQSGNLNPNPEYRVIYSIPWVKNDFIDDFEGEVTLWTRSTNVFFEITTDGWRWGEPVFGSDWIGPETAYSGAKCWGTMDGPYDRFLDAWVQSPLIPVGGQPVLSFQLWLEYGQGDVEINDGIAWRNVTPDSYFTSTGGAWVEQRIPLDNAVFGNRTIRVRFRSLDGAMYIDDVRLDSQRGPAVWMVEAVPTHGPAGTTVPVTFQVYNSTTSTLAGVYGEVTCADAGVTIGGDMVAYGTLAPGAVANGGTAVNVSLPTVMTFDPVVQLHHQTQVGATVSADDIVPFGVDGAILLSATNLLTVKASVGVVDWLDRPLAGNGSETACLFQVIYAGSNGVPDAPTSAGQATGDDLILYSSDLHQPWGRFGEGAVAPHLGRFIKSFAHALSSNAFVYVRAWDAASFKSAMAYGDSGLYALSSASGQTHDFLSWRVDRPTNFSRDSNGDSLPDGWSVLHGLDPRLPVAPLPLKVVQARAITDCTYPNRVAVSTNFVFVADTENNRVQVWDRALMNRRSILGATASPEFKKPAGIAVSRDGTRVAVADTLNYRVRVFSVTLATGTLVPLFNFGEYGTNVAQFNAPLAVAFGPSGDLFVADSKAVGLGNNRLQVFDANGGFLREFGVAGTGDGEFGRLLGVGVGPGGELYAADGPNNRVQALTAGTAFDWAYGTSGASAGQFNWAWEAQPGFGGLLFVTDLYNNRIQILNTRSAPAVSFVGAITNAGALGSFNLPRGAITAPDDGVLYVADTYNHRVVRLEITLDSDGDGMDDVWELRNGLNPADPTDAYADLDQDGVWNIGEYRAGTDPNSQTLGINLKILGLGMEPSRLSWLALTGRIYRVQSTTNLVQPHWTDGTMVTSKVNGWLSFSNAFVNTNQIQFMRVQWINTP